MIFINECGCLFDENLLSKAIINECALMGKKPKEKYRIVLRNSYPMICIAHDRFYVHRLIWCAKNGMIGKDVVIHHGDRNKLNNEIGNLECMTSNEHILLHNAERIGVDLRTEEGKWRGVNAARTKKYKRDITKEKIEKLLCSGIDMSGVAKELNCSVSTIRRRLTGRDYKTVSEIGLE